MILRDVPEQEEEREEEQEQQTGTTNNNNNNKEQSQQQRVYVMVCEQALTVIFHPDTIRVEILHSHSLVAYSAQTTACQLSLLFLSAVRKRTITLQTAHL